MGLVTGVPQGVITEQSEVYLEGAPYIYYQELPATPLWNPDGDGYYWGISGTSVELACYEDVQLSEDVTVNAIRCDKTGDAAVIQKRNYLELSLTLSNLLPLSTIAPILKSGSDVLTSAPFEKMGIGTIDNNMFYRVWLPKVYDADAFDFVTMTLHRCQFINPFNITMRAGQQWQIGGINIRAFADADLPDAQKFATVIRYDPSLIT
jgi:hypothetical protein